ncbi:MAG: hypothetical protein BRC40_07605 [Cyanobacteria bacterium QH_8_48_120]|jgi:hypothetical protein|nr:MAG: hypothetical protein BRC34_15500 [Cyanobacteria bacterium QH_1_48_107]PSO59308.1 MAG: hypothetical protein BRC39_11430 [Cyanobacteria bacterium QH_7_48_89]PSO65307.1 MAG: hypothetical protein BRC38_09160 [Cyanobacteria bacterium QH_6_48_35]PSO73833.1 MAG: hypothetical protein BRC40_07605 [Cyanobacteria bacterium QH_8_48_120]PSO74393.1 MAG: hypothetical protein BRC42_02495 [Cyanobacteria bacterium QS_1_48_34]PSO75258.1 MAG: hypothetical protein BRC37_05410 [Cyanobacteria bacterium QH_3_
MGNKVLDMPSNYKKTQGINEALGQMEKLDFESQISVLRQVTSDMGYSEVGSPPTQEETGKTSSL